MITLPWLKNIGIDRRNGITSLLSIAVTFLILHANRAETQSTAPALTVERIYDSPAIDGNLATEIEWSPDGKFLTYLQAEGPDRRDDSSNTGKSSAALWMVETATGKRRPLLTAEQLQKLLGASARVQDPRTSLKQDTGLARSSPQRYLWQPAGGALLLVSPTSMEVLDLKSGSRRVLLHEDGRLSPVSDVKFSPNGRYISFVRDHDLWIVEASNGQETRLTFGGQDNFLNGQLDWLYAEELMYADESRLSTAYWWAPDSSQIAYLETDDRAVSHYPLSSFLSADSSIRWMAYPRPGGANPIVRVAVVSLNSSKLRQNAPVWMNVGSEDDSYVPRVYWLPNSKQLVIERLNRRQNRLDILLADVKDGATRLLFGEEDKTWINLSNDLHFLGAGDRFLWSSERDGFRHLYLYDIGGKQLRQLTAGDWEVTRLVHLDEQRGVVYFCGTKSGELERHLFTVGLNGGAIHQVTTGHGTHRVDMSPNSEFYLDTYSDINTPPSQKLVTTAGAIRLVITDSKDAPITAYKLQPVNFLTVPAANGDRLNAMMIKPLGFDARRKYPVIVYVYGGPGVQLVRNNWAGPYFLWHQVMAAHGFIIFTIDGRGSSGRGHLFESTIYRRLGEVEIADQRAGVDYLRSLPYVDSSRIGIWGRSYGGYMTCLAMVHGAGVFKAGLSVAPVTDWLEYDTAYTERYLGTPEDNADGYKLASPITYAASLAGKLMIVAATGDDNVHFSNTAKIADQFIRSRKPVQYDIYPDRGHFLSDQAARVHLFEVATQFFLDNL